MKKSQKTKSHSKRRRRGTPKVRSRCFFCEKSTDPMEEDDELLKKFLTRRGKIRPRSRSGLCSKHQRRLSQTIKRKRNLGTVPYRVVA